MEWRWIQQCPGIILEAFRERALWRLAHEGNSSLYPSEQTTKPGCNYGMRADKCADAGGIFQFSLIAENTKTKRTQQHKDLNGTTRRCLESIFFRLKNRLGKACSWIQAREETPRQNQKTAMLYQRKQSFICFHRSSHNKHENKPRKTDNVTLPLSAHHNAPGVIIRAEL